MKEANRSKLWRLTAAAYELVKVRIHTILQAVHGTLLGISACSASRQISLLLLVVDDEIICKVLPAWIWCRWTGQFLFSRPGLQYHTDPGQLHHCHSIEQIWWHGHRMCPRWSQPKQTYTRNPNTLSLLQKSTRANAVSRWTTNPIL